MQVGIFGKDVQLPFDQVLYKELSVSSGFASTPKSWTSAMRLIEQGRIELVPLITKRVALSDFASALQGGRAW